MLWDVGSGHALISIRSQDLCYAKTLEIHGAVVKDLGALRKVAVSDELDDSQLNRMTQRLSEFETAFSSMSQDMRNVRDVHHV